MAEESQLAKYSQDELFKLLDVAVNRVYNIIKFYNISSMSVNADSLSDAEIKEIYHKKILINAIVDHAWSRKFGGLLGKSVPELVTEKVYELSRLMIMSGLSTDYMKHRLSAVEDKIKIKESTTEFNYE